MLDFVLHPAHTAGVKRIVLLSLCALSFLNAQESLTLETVAASRNLWPREVTVNVAHQIPIIINGKPSGSMQAPAGRVYIVKSVSANGVAVDAAGSALTFPAADTDLLVRAGQTKTRLEAQAAATPVSAPPAPAPAAVRTAPTPAPVAENAISKALSGDLVSLDGKKLKKFDASTLGGKKYFAIYRSAAWCGPCRDFTPDLVSWYNRKKSARDKFEVILVSSDRSEDDMANYMKEDKMPWPALDFSKVSKRSPITGFGGKGIPDLTIIDADGKVLSKSYEGETYVGPRKVLQDLEDLLKGA